MVGEPAEDTQRCGRTRLGRFGEGLHGLGFHKSTSTINVEENAEAGDKMIAPVIVTYSSPSWLGTRFALSAVGSIWVLETRSEG